MPCMKLKEAVGTGQYLHMNNINIIKFDERGLVPAIIQEYSTGMVLMMAYMNKEALERTISTGKAHYFSRSRNKLWLKGETSGNFQEIKAIYYDCDEDTILLSVHQTGVACHTGEKSCFFRRLVEERQGQRIADCGLQIADLKSKIRNRQLKIKEGQGSEKTKILSDLFETIKSRKTSSVEKSYVASLYSKGKGKILEKIREESAELVDAAEKGIKKEIIHETADLLFHNLVLLGAMDIELEDVMNELNRRTGVSGIAEKAARSKK